jgi:hypothetical protein
MAFEISRSARNDKPLTHKAAHSIRIGSCAPVLLYPFPVFLYSCYSCASVLLYSCAPAHLCFCAFVLLCSCAPVIMHCQDSEKNVIFVL